MTELCDFTFNLDANPKKDMGQIKVGDVKEFRLTVSVIAGYETWTPLRTPLLGLGSDSVLV